MPGRSTGAAATFRWKVAYPHFLDFAGQNQGALAQLGERLICIQEVIGSIPIGSTTSHLRSKFDERVAKDGRACGVRSVIARLDRALLEEIGSVAQVVRAYA